MESSNVTVSPSAASSPFDTVKSAPSIFADWFVMLYASVSTKSTLKVTATGNFFATVYVAFPLASDDNSPDFTVVFPCVPVTVTVCL